MASIAQVQLKDLPFFTETSGTLVCGEGNNHIPFAIARFFSVQGSLGAIRGKHAHKACTQFLICLSGSIEVCCDDASRKQIYVLDSANKGLLIPPGIWAECKYTKADSVLMALCDLPYEVEDYIKDYKEFKIYKGSQ